MPESAGALAGVRVVEFGNHIAASYCTKLLGDLGATVTKVEPRGGDPLRRCGPRRPGEPDLGTSGLFQYLNANKESVVADLADARTAEQARLLTESADIVVENFRPGALESFGLGPDVLLARNRRLVVVRISNFGQDGPWHDGLASGLTLQAEVGLALRLGDPERPLHIVGRIVEYIGGTFVAGGALAGMFNAVRSKTGTVVDVSLFEALLYSLSPTDVLAEQLHELGMYLPERSRGNPGFARCRDGTVSVSTLTAQQWEDLCALIGADEWTSRMRDVQVEEEARTAFLARLERWTSVRTMVKVVDTMQLLRIAAAQVADGRTMLELSQFTSRGFFVDQPGESFVRPAAPYRLSATPVTLRAPAPRLGEHSAAAAPSRQRGSEPQQRAPSETAGDSLPLAGVRVVDLTSYLSGGHLTEYLTALGADVVKIESPRRPDGYRFVMTYPVMGEHWWECSPLWQAQNLNKRSLVLELSLDRGREVLSRMIARSDVIAENYTPRVLDAFGFDFEHVHKINPATVMVRMPAFGLEGPWRDHVGFAYNIEQLGGMAQSGERDGPFVQPYGIVDIVNGQHALVATLAALWHQRNGGEGQLVEVAQVETVACLTADQVIEYQLTGKCRERMGNRAPGCAPQGVYPCRDGRWVAITVIDDDQWHALRATMGDPVWADDPALASAEGRSQMHDVLDERIAAWTRVKSAEEISEQLQAAAVPAGVLVTRSEISSHPQLEARGFHRWLPHEYVGTQRYPRPPVVFSFGDLSTGPAPTFGQHNGAILRELGFDDAEIIELAHAGVIATDLVSSG